MGIYNVIVGYILRVLGGKGSIYINGLECIHLAS